MGSRLEQHIDAALHQSIPILRNAHAGPKVIRQIAEKDSPSCAAHANLVSSPSGIPFDLVSVLLGGDPAGGLARVRQLSIPLPESLSQFARKLIENSIVSIGFKGFWVGFPGKEN